MSKKAILEKKLEDLVNKRNSTNLKFIEKIEKENSLLNDTIVNLGKNGPVSFYANGKMKMNIQDMQYGIHSHALQQLATKMGIPTRYVKDLNTTDWGRNLLQKILTEHKDNISRSRLLLREVGGQIRGVLSDKYRRLNSEQLYEVFIKNSKEMGAVIYEADHFATKSYISTVIPEVIEIPTENNGTVFSIFGAKISNSDFGDGALNLRAFQINVACMNGMTSETLLNQVHLGKRLPNNINFSDRTYKLDTKAMASAIDDMMKDTLSNERILKTAQIIKKASSIEVDMEKEILKLPKMGVLKPEIEMIEKKLLQNNEEDGVVGKATKWKLSQAINSVGRDLEIDNKISSRKHELQELAGKIINL